jgi:LysM repeat protein
VIVVIAATLGGGDGDGSHKGAGGTSHATRHQQASHHTPKSYEVQSGDTLTSIAHQTGVPVARILRLNPGIDPQILISGEELKLK